jgi:acyl CoA:acetate/3-ketoacid CoA transferase
MPSPYQFTYFQGGGFDASLLSFLEIDRQGSVNVSKLGFRPHVTAGAGGFVDITARARRIVFSGFFTAGADLDIDDGTLVVRREGKVRKLVERVDQVSFSGPRAVQQGQHITYVTERCVMELTRDGLAVTEIAPGVDLDRDVLAQANFPLLVPQPPRLMDRALFRPDRIGLTLKGVQR